MLRMALMLVVLSALQACAAVRILRPRADVYERPGATVGPGRVRLVVHADAAETIIDREGERRLIAGLTRAGQVAAGREPPPEPYTPPLEPVVMDGATLIPGYIADLDLFLSKHGYAVVREPPFDLEVEFVLGRVRYDRDDGWVADRAALRFRHPRDGSILKSVEVTDAAGPLRPSVLIAWLGQALTGRPFSPSGRLE
jgi:hypothetical protein